MIEEFNDKDLNIINSFLKSFDFNINSTSLNNDFMHIITYKDSIIKGVLVYSLIYDRVEIDYIIVDEKYRNHGIATKLLNYVIENNNISNITLEVRESNVIAINFYEKNGFKKAALRKNYYKNEDAILMIKKIGE